MIILTGPTAAGKNTIANIVAKKRERCAVVDFDLVRKMFVQPHKTPWDGEEGRSQQQLGVEMVCFLGRKFIEKGWEVVILDVVDNNTVNTYKELLIDHKPLIVLLLPTYDVIKDRFDSRGPVLSEKELKEVYKNQARFTSYDYMIDNSSTSPGDVAEQIIKLMQVR